MTSNKIQNQKEIRDWQRIFPNSNLFVHKDECFEKAVYEKILRVCGIKIPQVEFQIEQTNMFAIEEMASSPVSLTFLQWILNFINARVILEIGTFIGISTMYMAKALPIDGKVITIEKFDHFADIARRNFEHNGFSTKIELIHADAYEVIDEIANNFKFDLIFIDGDKERYADYLDKTIGSVRNGGVIVIDDVLFDGDVLNNIPITKKGYGVLKCLDKVKALTEWQKVLLPISSGILLLRKPE